MVTCSRRATLSTTLCAFVLLAALLLPHPTLAAGSGFTNAYNILEGFEGDKDAGGHRNKVGGWRHANLPWTQG